MSRCAPRARDQRSLGWVAAARLAELAPCGRSVRTPSSGEGGIGSPLRGSPSSRPEVARFEPPLAERGGLASPRCAGLAELAPCGRSVRTPFSGEGGIRTPKPVRAPVFETGALPFCHLSECRLPGCSRKLLKRPVDAAGEGAPRWLLLSNFRGGRGGIGSPAPRVRRARDQRSLGWVASLPELAPFGRSVRTHEGGRFRPCLVKLLNGRGGIGSPLRGSPSSLPLVARFEPTRAGAFAPAS